MHAGKKPPASGPGPCSSPIPASSADFTASADHVFQVLEPACAFTCQSERSGASRLFFGFIPRPQVITTYAISHFTPFCGTRWCRPVLRKALFFGRNFHPFPL